MPALPYQYNKPSQTFTIDQFIACQSNTDICYQNLSFVDKAYYSNMNETIKYPGYNVLSDYIDEIREEYCVTVTLTDKDMLKYKYRPKLLCHDIYGNGELFFIILIINDIYSDKQFIKDRLLMPTKDNMKDICKHLYSANYQAINKYNNKK